MKVHEQHKHHAPKNIKLALVIVSTSRHKEKILGKVSSDKTVNKVKQIFLSHDIILESINIVPDSENEIKQVLENLLSRDTLNGILFSGGTGLSPKDITYETIEPLLEKKLPGFGELFRFLSYKEIGSSAMLSRAIAGTIKNLIIFLLPGSPHAVKLALEELIIPEMGHMIYLLNKKE
jgi:molybdenum cofactor biosynthesis protein B